ncbi:class I adenylate-forming enzyme family protein [Rhodococcus sp. 105337]|uniref:class I adenylate-forming enzyme family protein n=1 Tax=Rhodococcus sp. 105337 TaxID=2725310 RepID=UPI00146A99DA|nr:class I adenylate-forming enzyme family protein [Rhodococcus sp. 105337]NME78166.1 acyl--CoA ligase [Rhodococcus sp. 105337]
MNLSMILEMAASNGDRAVATVGDRTLTAARLDTLARRAAVGFRNHPAVLYSGANHLAYPVALFGAALAGVPFVPLNYRLGEQQLTALKDRHPGALVLDEADLDALTDDALGEVDTSDLEGQWDGDAVAAIIYTSGTTSDPKPAILRHRHLLAYVLNTMEFASAAETDASLVSVPPYHIAGLTNLLSNFYTGRRVVYLAAFDPKVWLDTVRREKVTHAMLVPTMLARIVAELGDDEAATPSLASLAYGGSRTPRPVLEHALRVFPHTGFVNAYGLTETASSIAVLGPDDHRVAFASDDPAVRERLGSVGRPLPGIEIEIRTEDGERVEPGHSGLIYVRGEQISGEYGNRSVLDGEGWFSTRDLGHLDSDGYLFVEGRSDDTIIRGGENIAPAEIEDVLLAHPGVTEAAVIGVSDAEWGQRLVAVLVGSADPEEVRQWVKDRLRSSKTPDTIVFRDELPKTETGKLLRRNLLAELENTHA